MVKRIGVVLMLYLSTNPALAAWFESTGQAVIHNDNKELARQQATREALRQALLFSGASIRSVQQMADGLLQDEDFEIRASGEVAAVEMVSEHFHDEYVEVTIRADIFPQDAQCKASDYKKTIVTSHFNFSSIRQSAAGEVYKITKPMAKHTKATFDKYAQNSLIHSVQPYSFSPRQQELAMQSMLLAEKVGSNYVLIGDIIELSMEQLPESTLERLSFWSEPEHQRHTRIQFRLINGATGEVVHDKHYQTTAIWPFSPHQPVDPESHILWQSEFGNAIKELLKEAVAEIDEVMSCEPAYGRILTTYNNQLTINMGKIHGVQRGDELSIFQMKQYYSPTGNSSVHFQLHPASATVINVGHDTATLELGDELPMANIQPNDFVVRR